MLRCLYLILAGSKFNPLRASSYIRTPRQIQKTKAVVNVQNKDQCCFAWALVSAVRPVMEHSDRVSSYPHFSSLLNFEGIEFPVKITDIPKFEKQNPDISINVYGLQKVFENGVSKYEVIGPLHFSSVKKNIHVNLLVLDDEVTGNTHYCWIKNLSRLANSQLTSALKKAFFCDGCLQYFRSEERLSQHMQNDCVHTIIKMPTTNLIINKYGEIAPNNILKFESFERQMVIPFVVYADFESVLEPIEVVEPNPEKPFSMETYRHKPFSFAYYIKCSFDDSLSKFVCYRGDDCTKKFFELLEADILLLYQNYLKFPKPMAPLTPLDELILYAADTCHICEKPFENDSDKVLDHCHMSSFPRGIAHSVCNLNFKVPKFIPIFCHNLKNYDGHFLIKDIAHNKEEISVLPQNKEKYISFSKKILVDEFLDANNKKRRVFLSLRFLDSFQFMASSLQTLAQNLNDDQCLEIRKHFSSDLEFNLMRNKGVFPYLYLTSIAKLDETNLPPKDKFYDSLREEHVSDEDYERACYVWNLFKCKTLGEYSDIYLKCDVLLLADIFENFRKVCLATYKLDPAHYYTAPGLSWDAMLKYTKVELELLTDPDMLYFFKKGIRGGVSQCVARKAEANNRFCQNYNPEKPSSFIAYLDMTNLYGKCLASVLPKSNFRWLAREEIQNLDYLNISDTDSQGYVLEVDLEYPEHLHDLHNDFPFCPENIIPPHSKCSKLIPNLFDKSNYIIHYRNLKQCVQHGLIVKSINRVLTFQQSDWLKPFIELNTQLRNNARNSFEKNFYKLIINSNFGKTMENVEKRRDIKLLSHWKRSGCKLGAENLIAKPQFQNCTIFSENLVALEFQKGRIVYNKPLYVGFSVLEISKTMMYDFFYEFLKPKYNEKVSLLYTDTDSFILNIETENFYTDMKENLNKFDTSNYKSNNIHEMTITQSEPGKMKDEYAGAPINLFYGTGAKAYCVNVDGKVIKKAKGVSKAVIDKQLEIGNYKKVVEDGKNLICKMYVFESRLHNMFTVMKNKIALSSTDDKRFLIPGTYKTLAWGHRDIYFYECPVQDRINILMDFMQNNE